MITADTITDAMIRDLIEDAEETVLAGYTALGRIDRHIEFADGAAEPFCACGRRWSQCDGSRKGCGKHRARARCAEILNERAKAVR